ncbi:MAG: hypothetical protein HZR80_00535 [Candidatus Heimdallarchaeota archaeon]
MKKKHLLTIGILTLIILSSIPTSVNRKGLDMNPRLAKGIDFESSVILIAYEYHIISLSISKGQAISGDWEATPTDVVSTAFLVFIVDSENLEVWKASSNLSQAVSRIPASDLLYLYDPLLRVDDIPLDNRRSGTFQTKVPYTDNWSLVLYAGPTAIPLTFSWHISVVEGRLLDIVLYSLIGTFGIVAITLFTVKVLRDKRVSYEVELEKIRKEEAEREEQVRQLEEPNEDY